LTIKRFATILVFTVLVFTAMAASAQDRLPMIPADKQSEAQKKP